MINIVLSGPPGAGKGTQATKLVDKYGFKQLSTGDIFRAIKKSDSPLAKEVISYMDKGMLVPDELTIRVLEAEVNMYMNQVGFIFDGFPRTIAQAEALDKFLAGKGMIVSAMLALEVNDEELKKRILLRGKDSGRADDQDPQIVEKRITEYNTKTAPLRDYYAAQGKYRSVYGIGDIEEIFAKLCKEVDDLR
ncbi:MAG TPA: adenylate kinase [Bacteroidia bacterium]|nr:adenylate kinase [Bacteroidia bacterium]